MQSRRGRDDDAGDDVHASGVLRDDDVRAYVSVLSCGFYVIYEILIKMVE